MFISNDFHGATHDYLWFVAESGVSGAREKTTQLANGVDVREIDWFGVFKSISLFVVEYGRVA